MVPKLAAAAAIAIALLAIFGSYSQMTALHLRQQNQAMYWPRRRTYLSGMRYNNRWQPRPNRSSYETFQGGGIGAGK